MIRFAMAGRCWGVTRGEGNAACSEGRGVWRAVSRGAAILLALALLAGARTASAAPAYTIVEIQASDADHDWRSLHAGEVVACVGGIVTHKFKQRFALRDPNLGTEWAAIEVRGYPVYPFGIEVGDQVDFDNVYVDEYRGATVLQYYSASSFTINSHNHPLPEPVVLSLAQVRYPAHPEDCERYAGMHVRIDAPLTVGALDLGAHEDNYELLAQADTAWASDYANTDIDSTYYVAPGQCYQRLTGILQRYTYEDWDYYQVLPTCTGDYVPCDSGLPGEDGRATAAFGLRPYPNPFESETRIRLVLEHPEAVRLEVFDCAGRRVDDLTVGPLGAGAADVVWDPRARLGREAATGIYLLRMTVGGRILTSRIHRID